MSTATKTPELLLYGAFGHSEDDDEIFAKDFVNDLNDLRNADAINVRLNSGGGSVVEGLAVYDAIMRARRAGQRIDTYNDGACFSMAAIVFQAGARRVMAQHSLLMLHMPSTGAGGNARELAKRIETLDKVAAQLTEILASRTKQSKAIINAWLDAETWFDCKEAIAHGLADLKYIDANNHSAIANRIFANRKIPDRYTESRRGPIEAALSDLECTARIARGTRYYNSFRQLGNQAAIEAERITKMPAVDSADLARVSAALKRITETEDWVREIY